MINFLSVQFPEKSPKIVYPKFAYFTKNLY